MEKQISSKGKSVWDCSSPIQLAVGLLFLLERCRRCMSIYAGSLRPRVTDMSAIPRKADERVVPQ